jgi:hypothetical protein
VTARFRLSTGMLLVTVLLSTAAPARAAIIDDPNLARGPLDLKRLVATKHDATAPMHLKLFTYGTWKARLLDAAERSRLYILFNTNSKHGEEFTGEIFFRGGRLFMNVTTRAGAFVRKLRVHHPQPNMVKTTVPRGLPNPDGNAWIAAAEIYHPATGACSSGCRDRIPTEGWLKVTPAK